MNEILLKKILITGSNGFIGKNLICKLKEIGFVNILLFNRKDNFEILKNLIEQSDYIIHLAGENRPNKNIDFKIGNIDLTRKIANYVEEINRNHKKHIPIIYSSTVQVEVDNAYGKSKLEAEKILKKLCEETNNPVFAIRIPGVFGKWCKPNYNSVIATFCHNISRNLPIFISDPERILNLIYIDDLIVEIIEILNSSIINFKVITPRNVHQIKLGDLKNKLLDIYNSNEIFNVSDTNKGFDRALYSTFISYLPTEKFSKPINQNIDKRGTFVEFLKTSNSGQISFFTAHPGIKRGSHYHHTKTEKFLVIKGKAHFKFKNIISEEIYETIVEGSVPKMVSSIPGWAHEVTNIGDEDMYVMLWANELFDKNNPDTFHTKL